MAGGARTDLRSPIPDPEDQKILELRQMGLLPQVDIVNDNPNNNIKDNQEEITMEMTKEEMEKKLSEIKAAAGEKTSSIPKPVKYAAAAGVSDMLHTRFFTRVETKQPNRLLISYLSSSNRS